MNVLQTMEQLNKRTSSNGLVGGAHAVHADSNKMDATAELSSELAVDVVTVRRERHGEPRFARGVLTNARELGMESWLAASKSHAEGAMRVKLG